MTYENTKSTTSNLDQFLMNQYEDKIIDRIAINTFNKWSNDFVNTDVKIEKSYIENPDLKVNHKLQLRPDLPINEQVDDTVYEFSNNIKPPVEVAKRFNRKGKNELIRKQMEKKLSKDLNKLQNKDIKYIVNKKLVLISEILEALQHNLESEFSDKDLQGYLEVLIELEFELKMYKKLNLQNHKYMLT